MSSKYSIFKRKLNNSYNKRKEMHAYNWFWAGTCSEDPSNAGLLAAPAVSWQRYPVTEAVQLAGFTHSVCSVRGLTVVGVALAMLYWDIPPAGPGARWLQWNWCNRRPGPGIHQTISSNEMRIIMHAMAITAVTFCNCALLATSNSEKFSFRHNSYVWLSSLILMFPLSFQSYGNSLKHNQLIACC